MDPFEIKLMMEILQPGDVAVDVGSHKGAYIYWMQKAVTKEGKVFSFEPQIELFRYLKKIIEIFNYSQVEVYHNAVSDFQEIRKLYSPSERVSTGATLVENLFEENDAVSQIESITLDNFFSESGREIQLPNFIKIDVEGHELEVLKGASAVLQKARPVIQFEAEQKTYGKQDISLMFDFLENLNFKGFFFFNGKLCSIGIFNLEIHQNWNLAKTPNAHNYANNFIYFPEEKLPDFNLHKFK